MKPVVSVLSITYNHAPYVRQFIESVLMQKTTFPFELVIGEDCSTDGTREIVLDYAQKYPEIIRVITSESNVGMVENSKRTYLACQGEFIAVCDGDDYWTDPSKLQKQVDFLDSHPDYVVCHHDAIVVDEHGVMIANSKLSDAMKRDFSGDELIRGAWILTLSACFRNVLEELPPEYLKVPNLDTFFFSMLGNKGCSKYMGHEIRPAAYRRHAGGVWSALNKEESLLYKTNTRYWLSRYYGRLGKKEYMKYWANFYRRTMIELVEADDNKYGAKACREFFSRRENLLDPRFAYYFFSKFIRTRARVALSK